VGGGGGGNLMSTFSTDNLVLRHTDMLYLHLFGGRVQCWACKYLMRVADLKSIYL